MTLLPPGQYVVEVVRPEGFEITKEEDKNILIGDNYIAPVTQEFPGLGSAIYILPDQAQIGAAYNAKEAFFDIYSHRKADDARRAYADWRASLTPEMERAATKKQAKVSGICQARPPSFDRSVVPVCFSTAPPVMKRQDL